VSLSAAAIRMMADKGLSGQDIADIAEANEPARSSGAVRQKRYRDNKRNERDVTRDVTPPPNERDNLTPTIPRISIVDAIDSPAEISELKPEHVVEVWNDLATKHGLAAVKKLTPERRKKLATFIRRHSIDDITEAIAAIPRSPFLLGQNGRGWQANFDWFLEPRNLTKLTEGTYVN
jgi:hypothetical protein